MGKKADEFYHEYKLTNRKTGDVYVARGFKSVLRLAGLATATPQGQLKRSKKWSVEITDVPATWDEATYRKHLYNKSKDKYVAYEEAKLLRDPLYQRRKQLRLSKWKNSDGSAFTAEQHEAMLMQPCAVCGKENDICVDHCHKTMVVRGSLCRRCNLALGYVDDDIKRLDNLKDYLLQSRKFNEQD